MESPHFEMLERYTVLLCNKNSIIKLARMELVYRENKTTENIPPTSDALLQHAKRATCQASV